MDTDKGSPGQSDPAAETMRILAAAVPEAMARLCEQAGSPDAKVREWATRQLRLRTIQLIDGAERALAATPGNAAK